MFGYDPHKVYKAANGARRAENIARESQQNARNMLSAGTIDMYRELYDYGKAILKRPNEELYYPPIFYIDAENEPVRKTMQREVNEWLKDIK